MVPTVGFFTRKTKNAKRYSVLEFLLTDSKRLVIKHTEVSSEKTGEGYGKSLIKAVSE
jgi:predicted GNAT family acetyltransferase